MRTIIQKQKRSMFKDKRGEFTDVMTILIFLFILAIFILLIMLFMTRVLSGFRNSTINDIPEASEAINSSESIILSAMPSGLLIVFFGLIIGLIFSSFYTRIHPVFLPVYIIIAIVSVFVAVVLSNSWELITDYPDFASLLQTNSITQAMNLLMTNLVKIAVVLSALGMIVIFAKPSPSGGGGEPY